MSRAIEEQLSAFLDDELPPEETDLLLRRLDRDPALRETLARYSMVSGILAGRGAQQLPTAFGDRIASALDGEAAHAGAGIKPARGVWLRGIAAAGIAAAVAVVAVLSLNDGPGTPRAPVTAAALPDGVAGAAAQPVSYTVPATAARPAVIAPARLTSYLVSHGEFSGSLSRRVLDSYIVNQAPPDHRDALDSATRGALADD